jgi:hypothetical protein
VLKNGVLGSYEIFIRSEDVIFHGWFDSGTNLSEGCFDEKMVEGSEGGFNSEVVHWDAGENHVDP